MLMKLIRDLDAIQGNLVPGVLIVDGHEFCKTVENKEKMIPELFYPVTVSTSPRFGCLLPLIKNVPRTKEHPNNDFRSGIRIHLGCKPEHSEGCVLLPTTERVVTLTQLLNGRIKNGESVYIEVIGARSAARIY